MQDLTNLPNISPCDAYSETRYSILFVSITWYSFTMFGWSRSFRISTSRYVFSKLTLSSLLLSMIFIATYKQTIIKSMSCSLSSIVKIISCKLYKMLSFYLSFCNTMPRKLNNGEISPSDGFFYFVKTNSQRST